MPGGAKVTSASVPRRRLQVSPRCWGAGRRDEETLRTSGKGPRWFRQRSTEVCIVDTKQRTWATHLGAKRPVRKANNSIITPLLQRVRRKIPGVFRRDGACENTGEKRVRNVIHADRRGQYPDGHRTVE